LVDAGFDSAGNVIRGYARPVRDGLILVGVLRAGWYYLVQGIWPWTFIGVDARAYWGVDLAHPYTTSGVGDVSTYLYSPAFAQITAPLSLLPYPVFLAVWIGVLAAVFLWLVKPWPWAALILVLPVSYELLVGNIHFLLAAALVVGLEWPIVLPLGVLTKITPGVAIGWHLVRRDWHRLAVGLGFTAAFSAISYLAAPSAWADWIVFLAASPGRSELLIPRIVLGGLLVVVGGLTGRRWLVPVAVWISLPVVWINSWVILLAVIRLRDRVAPVAPVPPVAQRVP
jgi:hypothetical protein